MTRIAVQWVQIVSDLWRVRALRVVMKYGESVELFAKYLFCMDLCAAADAAACGWHVLCIDLRRADGGEDATD
ncbi:hypothetical protein CTTA_3369 [Comamonas testosteroni]|uniref:Uncharacterized protein n=1 Tax=Comamonas testosteroni TaxID=285 RepID=A0A5A7MHG8_COMTE|nr:hypothetical protein [Comamonas testosteroni]GEQ76364.1 hypothetical protein CTTA_3369 [Comamonas testosteroni]